MNKLIIMEKKQTSHRIPNKIWSTSSKTWGGEHNSTFLKYRLHFFQRIKKGKKNNFTVEKTNNTWARLPGSTSSHKSCCWYTPLIGCEENSTLSL